MSHNLLINRPATNYFEAVFTAGQTVDSTPSPLSFDTPIFNDCFTDSSGTLTCTVAGDYLIHAIFYKDTSARIGLIGKKNSTYVCGNSNSRGDFQICLTFSVSLAVGDTLSIDGNLTSSFTGGMLGKAVIVRLQ